MTRDEQIERFLAAVSDRMDADWDELERTSRNAEDRELVRNLRALRRIADHGAPLALAEEDGPGSTWAHLTLLERIGAGSFGEVHRAWDPKLSIDVALKLIPARLADADDAMREARLLARVRHDHVARVYGADRHGDFVGIWTEFVDGVTLEDVAREAAPLPEARLLGFARQLLAALSAIHGANVLHRDLKPRNVLVDRDDRLVVTDFGCGAPRGRDGEGARAEFAGTPRFMAPELFAGGPPTPGTDGYALGVLLFRLATGRYPTDASGVSALREAHARGERRRLAEERPDLPARFTAAVDRALDPEPTKRFASARQWLEAIDAASDEAPAPALAPPRASRPAGRPLLAAAVAALAIAVVAGLVVSRPTAPLSFEVELLRAAPDAPFAPVPPGDASVDLGDRLMLRYEASRAAHVYVINWDDRGRAYLLFPMDASELRNPVPGGAPHHLPGLVTGQPYAWEVSSGAGRESFAVIASIDRLEDFERALAGTPRVQVDSAGDIPPDALAGLLRGVGRATPVPDSPGGRAEDVLEILRLRLADDPALARRVSLRTLSIGQR